MRGWTFNDKLEILQSGFEKGKGLQESSLLTHQGKFAL